MYIISSKRMVGKLYYQTNHHNMADLKSSENANLWKQIDK